LRKAPTKPTPPYRAATPTSALRTATTVCATTKANSAHASSATAAPSKSQPAIAAAKSSALATKSTSAAPACDSNAPAEFERRRRPLFYAVDFCDVWLSQVGQLDRPEVQGVNCAFRVTSGHADCIRDGKTFLFGEYESGWDIARYCLLGKRRSPGHSQVCSPTPLLTWHHRPPFRRGSMGVLEDHGPFCVQSSLGGPPHRS